MMHSMLHVEYKIFVRLICQKREHNISGILVFEETESLSMYSR